MPTTERARDRGRRQASSALLALAAELRDARRAAGLSQGHVARIAGLNQSRVSRTERAQRLPPRLDELAMHCAALGLRLSVRAYPEGTPARDGGQLRLLERFRSEVHPGIAWRTEVPVGGPGDLRAWDAVLDAGVPIGIDAETRLHDIQALQRRLELKRRDSGIPRVVLVVASTRHDRTILREHRAALASTFPLDTAVVMAALRAGEAPPENGIVVI